jgi:hydroxymethylpyrimidine pyrophosphatase-like HAD family hydrolase
MNYKVFATDGDGTLLIDGKMPARVSHALVRAREAGILLILVTGETTQELTEFPHLDLFHLVVAENGAVLFNPTNGLQVVLGQSPPSRLVHALQEAGLKKLRIGRSIVSGRVEDEETLRDVVKRLMLDWHVIRNRHDAMVLPRGIDKASGLKTALAEINITPSEVIAIGDAENDEAMRNCCGLGVVVAGAVSLVKARAQFITRGGAGFGVVEVIEDMLNSNLRTPLIGNCLPATDSFGIPAHPPFSA